MKWKLARLDAEIEHHESAKSDPNDWNYGYTYGTNLVMRIHTMQQLGYPQTDIEQYIQAHYENRQVRNMLISDAFKDNDYQEPSNCSVILRPSMTIRIIASRITAPSSFMPTKHWETMRDTNRLYGKIFSISTRMIWSKSQP